MTTTLRNRIRRPGSEASFAGFGFRGSPLRRTTLRARAVDAVSRKTIRGLDAEEDEDRGTVLEEVDRAADPERAPTTALGDATERVALRGDDVVRAEFDRGATGFDAAVRGAPAGARGERAGAAPRALVPVLALDRPVCDCRAPVVPAELAPPRVVDERGRSVVLREPAVRGESVVRPASVLRAGAVLRPDSVVRGEAFRSTVRSEPTRAESPGRGVRGRRPPASPGVPALDRGVRGVGPDGVIAPPQG
ncbi:hypothetical protein [Sanguibacter sp. 25GB23B1]|uniref:hypothetical protein n=1 Tax=unclassified Sanguibacter TaxID=2645534 RepID=UPI0032AFB345